jgi:uncharacterized membrane protein HdeD (DUF308 family)
MRRLDLSREQALDLAGMWWLLVFLGLVSLAAGVILVAKPSNSLAALAVVFGIFLLIDGIVELIASFGHGVENRALSAILGVLGIVIGIALIRHPFHGVAAIGILIGIWLVAAGVIRLVRAFVVSAHPVIQILIALLEIVVGIVIVSDPHIGYATLAILTGIWLIINGIGTIVFAVAIRRVRPEEIAPSQSAEGPAG